MQYLPEREMRNYRDTRTDGKLLWLKPPSWDLLGGWEGGRSWRSLEYNPGNGSLVFCSPTRCSNEIGMYYKIFCEISDYSNNNYGVEALYLDSRMGSFSTGFTALAASFPPMSTEKERSQLEENRCSSKAKNERTVVCARENSSEGFPERSHEWGTLTIDKSEPLCQLCGHVRRVLRQERKLESASDENRSTSRKNLHRRRVDTVDRVDVQYEIKVITA